MALAHIHTPRFGDQRGWFAETYNERRFGEWGIPVRFVQDNHSLSRPVGTVRGLHYQAPPCGQAKLVRVVRGRILDVAVDARRGSPTYGEHVAVELSAEAGDQLFLPVGFLHGFVTLEPDTEVVYKVSDFYDRASDGGVRWNDPTLGIAWGVATAVVSEKDAAQPLFADWTSPFDYDGVPMALRHIG
jgi:dTDP-4-dehydrorhamnose 3,5-epimerase